MEKRKGFIRTILVVILLFIGYRFIPHDEHRIIDNQTYSHINISFGKEILIKKEPWLSDRNKDFDNSSEDNIPWKNKCFNNWSLKEKGISGDGNSLRDFVEQCPRDAEAAIYFNNQLARDSGKPTIKIAVSVPITRSNGVFDAREILKGVELAQRRINNLEVGIIDEGWETSVDSVIEDWNDKSNKDQEKLKSQLVASQLANSDVVAVVGHFSSDAIEAAAPIYRENQLIAISPTSTARRKTNKRNKVAAYISSKGQLDEPLRLNNYIFRTAPNDIIAIERLITGYVEPKKIKKVIVVYDATSKFSRLYQQEFKRQIEDQEDQELEVMNLSLNKDNCAFKFDKNNRIEINQVNDCISKIVKDKPDAILIVFSTAHALQLKSSQTIEDREGNFFKLIEDKIEDIPQLLGADSAYKEGFLSETEAGMIVSVPMAIEKRNFDSKVNQEIEPISVNWRTSMAYDATIAIAKGIEENKNNRKCVNLPSNRDKCRQQIQKALTSRQFIATGMMNQGSIEFDKNGDRIVTDKSHLAVLLEVKKDQDSYSFAPYYPHKR